MTDRQTLITRVPPGGHHGKYKKYKRWRNPKCWEVNIGKMFWGPQNQQFQEKYNELSAQMEWRVWHQTDRSTGRQCFHRMKETVIVRVIILTSRVAVKIIIIALFPHRLFYDAELDGCNAFYSTLTRIHRNQGPMAYRTSETVINPTLLRKPFSCSPTRRSFR